MSCLRYGFLCQGPTCVALGCQHYSHTVSRKDGKGHAGVWGWVGRTLGWKCCLPSLTALPNPVSGMPVSHPSSQSSAASVMQNVASRGENLSSLDLTIKGLYLIRLQVPVQVSQEQRSVQTACVDILWVSSVSTLSGVFVMKGVKLTVRSSSFTVPDSEGSSLPNHHPFLWKTLTPLCDTIIILSPTLEHGRVLGIVHFSPQSKLHSLCYPAWAHWFPASVSPILQQD